MSLWFYDSPFSDFSRDIDRFFTEPFDTHPRSWLNEPSGTSLMRRPAGTSEVSAQRFLRPRMDLHEDADANTVTATFELPGLNKENVQIDVNDGRLTVSGETRLSTEHEEGGYAVRERRHGRFSRTVQLPQGVTDEQIKANMEHGVLMVTFPRSSPETAPKRITIS
ncbi:hypothetical protein AX17_005939 [Amanita inopinata Kibby_2008]|nr:hypothetical protein AX17_005939 [Amanita inopinata Kibby_2008]